MLLFVIKFPWYARFPPLFFLFFFTSSRFQDVLSRSRRRGPLFYLRLSSGTDPTDPHFMRPCMTHPSMHPPADVLLPSDRCLLLLVATVACHLWRSGHSLWLCYTLHAIRHASPTSPFGLPWDGADCKTAAQDQQRKPFLDPRLRGVF